MSSSSGSELRTLALPATRGMLLTFSHRGVGEFSHSVTLRVLESQA
jgi:hypothetical protein